MNTNILAGFTLETNFQTISKRAEIFISAFNHSFYNAIDSNIEWNRKFLCYQI